MPSTYAVTDLDTVPATASTRFRLLGASAPRKPRRMAGASMSMNSERKPMVVRARIVEKTALPRLVPTLSAGFPKFWAAVWILGAFFCTQLSK